MAHAKRLAAVLPLVLAVLSFSGAVFAQSVVITQTQRDDIDPGRDPLSINRSECLANGTVEVTVTVNTTSLDDPQLEVWGGTGTCEDDETRNQLNSTQCWRIFSDEADTQTIPLRIQDMVRPSGESGDSVCDQASGSFTVWFLLVEGTVNKTPSAASLVFKFDLSGPTPPVLTGISAGESSLVLRWDGSNSNDLDGYRIYCEEAIDEVPGTSGSGGVSATAGSGGTVSGNGGAGGTAGTSGGTEATSGTAGVSATGGTAGAETTVAGSTAAAASAGATSDNGCRGERLVGGQVPPDDLRRGSASQASDEGTAKGLQNGKTYACGIAAYDDDDNLGELSNMRCAKPRPVIDYFEAYRRAGGTAGGGYCSFGRASTGQALGALAGLGALALVLRRRSRRGVS